MSAGTGAKESPRGAEADSPRIYKGSLLGVSLGGPTAQTEDPSSPRDKKFMIDFAMTDKIAKKYTKHVLEAEHYRKAAYVPLDQQQRVIPDEQSVARVVKQELDACTTVMNNKGSNGNWNVFLGNDSFQKRMQFLCNHAKTGHFIESYGKNGRYEGEFLYGMRHGKGTHEFQGDVYEGEWKWDMRHGWGHLACQDGSVIKGNWQGGKPHGFTSMVDSKGVITYEGEFQDGKRQGLGRQRFESGDMYDGGWHKGKLHDRGVYYFTNGDKLYGMWNQGLYDGVGVFHYADGSISRRQYKDGLLMSVQDYEHSSQRFGKTLTRDGMQRHTRDQEFPKDVFLLS